MSISSTVLYGKRVFVAEDFRSQIILRRTSEILRKTLYVYPFNRDQEAGQLINVIKHEGKGSRIFKTDVKNFFEAINIEQVAQKLQTKGFRNNAVLSIINEIIVFLKECNHYGLPRGLALSSILAEYYLEDFDKFVSGLSSVSYYGRYVDDIVIIYKEEGCFNIKNEVEEYLLKNLGLHLNSKKIKDIEANGSGSFDYLGYLISSDGKSISISGKKINKTKKRLVLSIKQYIKDKDYLMLMARIKYLSSNVLFKKGDNRKILAGFRYFYPYCHCDSIKNQLLEIDVFYRNILFSKKFGASQKLRLLINKRQFKDLVKISFLAGYEKKITISFSRNKISSIKKAWLYE